MVTLPSEDHYDYQANTPPQAPRQKRLDDDQWSEIIERYLSGERCGDLAKEFNVSHSCVSNHMRERLIQRGSVSGKIRDTNLRKFSSEARSILWREENGINERHPLYHGWKDAVEEFKSKHKCSLGAAIIQVCKNYKQLWPLFRRYNVEQFDKYPESHPGITAYRNLRKKEKAIAKIRNEGVEQSHRQNLSWAISAAGENARTGVDPESCPNDAAYYLYMQAIESPKEFLARFTAIESKANDGDAPNRLASERSIGELDSMLDTILDDSENDEEIKEEREEAQRME